jgi:hypothetical protein
MAYTTNTADTTANGMLEALTDIATASITTVTDTASDNNYTYTVPAGEQAWLSWVHMVYTSDATVGNREIVMALLNDSDTELADFHSGAVQAASNVYHYTFLPGIYRETAFALDAIQVPFAQRFIIPAGWKIKIYDTANISSSDSISVSLQYQDISTSA